MYVCMYVFVYIYIYIHVYVYVYVYVDPPFKTNLDILNKSAKGQQPPIQDLVHEPGNNFVVQSWFSGFGPC